MLYMKAIRLIIYAVSLSTLTISDAKADGVILPGDITKGRIVGFENTHVIRAADRYLQKIRSDGPREEVDEEREKLKNCILQYPDEINDCYYESGANGSTALSIAARYNDSEMVRFLLAHGACPFFPSTKEMQDLFSNEDISKEIKQELRAAQRSYNILEAIISSQNTKRI